MQTAWKTPGTVAVQSAGTIALNNRDNVKAEDNNYATSATAVAKNDNTDKILCTNFGFTLPVDTRITEVEIRETGYMNVVTGVPGMSSVVGLRKTVAAGLSFQTTSLAHTTTEQTHTHNNTTYPMYGEGPISRAEAQSADFGIAHQLANLIASSSADFFIDSIEVRLHFNYILQVDAATQNQSDENATVSLAAESITPADASQSQASEQPTLTQAAALAAQATEQAQEAQQAELTQEHQLTPSQTIQEQESDQVALVASGSIAVSDSGQAQVTGSPGLTQEHILAIQGAIQDQIIDPATLEGMSSITPSNSQQAQQADAVNITEYSIIAIQDTTQSQLIEFVRFGGVVFVELDGKISLVAQIQEGELTLTPLIDGTIEL